MCAEIDSGSHDESPEFVDVPIKPTRDLTAESTAAAYMAQTGSLILEIEGSSRSKVPLMSDEGLGPVYDMGTERGGPVRAFLRVVSINEHNGFNIEVPLRMMPYKTAKNPEECFGLTMCQALDVANMQIEEHNRYITSLLSLFANANGCGTSAGHVTLPAPPENLTETRIKRLKDIFKDKYGSAILAVRYLHKRGKICEKDYAIENAVNAANDEAFEEYVREKRAKGTFRFRIPGSLPTHWDGNPEHEDGLGRKLEWSKGENHSFISPEIRIIIAHMQLAV